MANTEVHFQTALDELKEQILKMGDKAERSIDLAVQCHLSRDGSLWAEVLSLESEVCQCERNIDEITLQLHARHQPKALHLRHLTACMKINTSLRLIGSRSIHIADQSMSVCRPRIVLPVNIPDVGNVVSGMIRRALVSFVDEDGDLAEAVFDMANILNRRIGESWIHLVSEMRTSPESIDQALGALVAIRNLERVADYAGNIAADVLFWMCGADARRPITRVLPIQR